MGLFFRNKTNITPDEAHERIKSGEKIVVLDVRTPSEFRQIRIMGAKLLPVDQIEARAAAELPDKTVPVLVYCQSGARADRAVGILNRMGYDAVSFGGIINWPYEVMRG